MSHELSLCAGKLNNYKALRILAGCMNLKSLSNIELLNGVRSLRGDERKLDRQIVEYIGEIESRRLCAELGFANVIDWLVKDLGYSESVVYWRPIDG